MQKKKVNRGTKKKGGLTMPNMQQMRNMAATAQTLASHPAVQRRVTTALANSGKRGGKRGATKKAKRSATKKAKRAHKGKKH